LNEQPPDENKLSEMHKHDEEERAMNKRLQEAEPPTPEKPVTHVADQ
jgi:hypothetical protein